MSEQAINLLPIGSVVSLEGGNKRLMIYGIKQTVEETGTEYDYIGVPYPEGNMGEEYQYLFNDKDITALYFRGYEDVERQQFIANLSEYYKSAQNKTD